MSEPTQPKGVIAWMAQHGVAANLLMALLLVGGLLGMSRLKQEVFPEFELDIVVVSVPYPGASPEEVEQGILLAAEEAVRGLDGIKRVNSVAAEGVGTVRAELLLGADPDRVLADVKNEIDRVQTFPEDAEDPQVQLATRRREVISLIFSANTSLRELHELAERARAELLSRGGVTQVEVFGVPPVEIAVELPRAQLEALGLTLDEVATQIRLGSLELPGGGLDTPSGELLVRVLDRRRTGEELSKMVLRGTRDGGVVRLGDVARITDGYEENDQASYFNGQRAVRLTAYRVGNETPTGIAEAVRSFASDFEATLPAGVELTAWKDDSELLRGRIDLLTRNARSGLLLVLLVLALFLDLRLALWVAVGIPVSFLGAFLLFPGLGVSINMVSLFALIITLGLVVDDAIVVGENIYEKAEQGMSRMTAAIEGAREMAVPVTFAILTTLAAFAPLFFVPGTTGKIFSIIPYVVVAVLFFSLVESFLVLPAHLGHEAHGRPTLIRRVGARLAALVEAPRRFVARNLQAFGDGPYTRTLQALTHRRYATFAGALAVLMVSLSTVAAGIVPFSFFPKIEGDTINATARLPYGAPVEQTEAVRDQLEASLRQAVDELGVGAAVRGVLSRVGEGEPSPQGDRDTGSHIVSIEVGLVPSEQRDITAAAFSAAWMKATPPIPGLDALIFNAAVGPGAGSAVDVQLSHTNTETLRIASDQVSDLLQSYPALTNVDNSLAAGKAQLDFRILPEGRTLGLTSSDVARQLRAFFFGAEALREQRGRDEVKIRARLPRDERTSEHDVTLLDVRTPAGRVVPLSSVASIERGQAPTTILREDGRRVVNVRADLAPGVRSPRDVLSDLSDKAVPELLASTPGLDISFAGEQRNQGEAFDSLGTNYLFALILMYALLAVPFRSYIQPLIIMAAIPFGVVGAVGGHLVMGFELSVISVMGIIALSGVVVNDSLVLIDAANRFRDQGMSATEAIHAAGRRRLRPILLTSLTTFFGLLPMIFEPSVQARFLVPMAISLGYGVLFATVIVLLVVPALYLIVEDAQQLVAPEPVPAPPASPEPSLS